MSETITYLPLHELRESPTNPRRFYAEAGLQELADSIKTQGIMSPIVVRPLEQADVEQTHEIIFGHRRFRAAGLAGLAQVPALVRTMTDSEAAVAQIHENLHRADVHALEEADAFRALMQDHGVPVEQIVADSGKSRSYVYGRLKLASITPKVRQACLEEGLGGEIALLIARLPHPKLQDEALQRMRSGSSEWVSYRIAKSQLQQFTVVLREHARFDLADASMPGGACAACPKMACNDPELIDLQADVCIDRACFDGKSAEHGRRVIALARETGRTIVEGDEAKAMMPSAYWMRGADRITAPAGITRPHPETGEPDELTWAEALDLLSPGPRESLRPILIVHPDTPDHPIEALTDEQQAEVTRLIAPEPTTPPAGERVSHTAIGASSHQGGGEEDLSAWSAEELALRDWDTFKQLEKAVLLQVRETQRTADELRLVLKREIDMGDDFGMVGHLYGWDEAERLASEGVDEFDRAAWYEQRIDALNPDEAAAIVVALAVVDQLRGGYSAISQRGAAATLALAKRYGVDVLTLTGQQQSDDTGSAGEVQKDEAAVGGQATGDLFSAAEGGE